MSSYINSGADQSYAQKALCVFHQDLLSLLKGLSSFKIMFTAVPSIYTQDNFYRSHNSLIPKYSSEYVGKKKSVKNQSDKIMENYSSADSTSIVVMDILAHTKVLEDISKYFSAEPDQLPAQYVDAYLILSTVVEKVSGYIKSLASLMSTTAIAMNDLRGTPGPGTKEIEALFTDAKALAAFQGNQKKIEHLELTDIKEVSKISLDTTVRNKNTLTGILKQGADKISAAMLRLHKERISRTMLIGFPSNTSFNRDTSLEDTVREKVRKKFGGIRFCDEEELKTSEGYSVFVKKSELTEIKSPTGSTVKVKKSEGDAIKIAGEVGYA